MSRITLKQLRYFEALAERGHFGMAASDCAISQPALSMQIRELEATLGRPLLERSARRVSLTPFGIAFRERSRAVLRSMDDLEALARVRGDALDGELKLGIIPTVAPYLLPRIIAALAGPYPDVTPHIRETITPTLLQDLAEGRLDLAIVALPVAGDTFDAAPLCVETFVLVRPSPQAKDPVPDADALREMRLLLLEEGHCFRDQALAFCSTTPRVEREMLDASSLSTLVQMVGAGMGVTLIPEMAVPVETRSADVAVSRFAAPEPARTIGMVWRRTSPMAPLLRALAEDLAAALTLPAGSATRHASQSGP